MAAQQLSRTRLQAYAMALEKTLAAEVHYFLLSMQNELPLHVRVEHRKTAEAFAKAALRIIQKYEKEIYGAN